MYHAAATMELLSTPVERPPEAGVEGSGAGGGASEQEGAAQTIGSEAKRNREEINIVKAVQVL